MQFKIDTKIMQQFPDVTIGVLVGKNVNNNGESDITTTLLLEIINNLKMTYKVEDITSIPKINEWRNAYKLFGCKPSKYHSSIESLLRRVLKNKPMPTISPLVDCYNYISLKYFVPAGGGDLDKIHGDIALTVATGNEQFMLLGTNDLQNIAASEVIYTDQNKVLCRAWNYRESEQSKITDDTQNVYLVLEGLSHTSYDEMQQALHELQNLVSKYCGGTFTQFILDQNNVGRNIS
ncbi:MAG: hypothetical protein CL947_02145 [Epsilonproteobacteria bacterium]|nr:hypothetical protein [Campylobacterota bacterium]|tara:strand:+ start:14191 stop:14895 length:705 start_codon:yes stop_codon:yes gene_type:complete